jgi:hypothetical protein
VLLLGPLVSAAKRSLFGTKHARHSSRTIVGPKRVRIVCVCVVWVGRPRNWYAAARNPILERSKSVCIDRESNPELGQTPGILEDRWEDPMLPLHHQCLLRVQSIVITSSSCKRENTADEPACF